MPRIRRLTLPLFLALATVLTFGCEREPTPSSTIGGISFVHDFEGERKVVRIELSPAQPADCMQATLPVGSSVTWKAALLEETLHADLLSRVFDSARVLFYEGDTTRTEFNERVCTPRPGEPPNPACIVVEVCEDGPSGEVCYRPEANVATDGKAWRFVLHPDFEPPISSPSQELVDAFLAAHDACWSGAGQLENGGTFPG